MSAIPWSEGYRKVGHKARNGRRHGGGRPHKSHHHQEMNRYESAMARERRLKIAQIKDTETAREISES